MLRTRFRAALAVLVLAVLAATALAVAEAVGAFPTTGERLSALLWLAGWVLLAWGAVLGVATLVRLLRAGRRTDAALAALGLACLLLVAVLHPLAGSGGAAA
ncbi:hypothetical protein [Klenkia brasiliensis]|uniref:hypothetical protein n=1 Tax=Klenkia brasiliensis TaxID=333142 RepID=UPI000B83F676|nr:hypothetical protein [Klenkia brasiliensis]